MKKIFFLFILVFIWSCGGKTISINEPVLATYSCNVVVTENYAYFVRDGKPTRELKKMESCLYGDVREQESHSRYFRVNNDGTGVLFGSDITSRCRIIGENAVSGCN